MATTSEPWSPRPHHRRASERGLVRVEVRVPQADAGLIRAIAKTLRDDPAKAESLRALVGSAPASSTAKTAFDVFGSDLPDEVFEGVFSEAIWRRAKPFADRRP